MVHGKEKCGSLQHMPAMLHCSWGRPVFDLDTCLFPWRYTMADTAPLPWLLHGADLETSSTPHT